MTDPDEKPPYRVEAADDKFKIVDEEGRVIITNNSSANAEQYAALMNQAYRQGYKAGFRSAKKARLNP